jgi:translation initiation factor IF-3
LIKFYKINEKITSENLRVIGPAGENFGVISLAEALSKAREFEKDLVLINADSKPPIAKILDFKKFLYDEKKKESSARAKSKKSEVKGLRLTSGIGEGDLMQRVARAKEFLAENHRVKFELKFKRYEWNNPTFAFGVINKVLNLLSDVGKAEDEPKIMGKSIIVVVLKK